MPHTHLFSNKFYQVIIFFESFIYHGDHGKHIFLFAQRVTLIVHGTVEMDGNMRNNHQRTLEIHELSRRFQRVQATQHNPSGHGQWSVEPRVHNRPPIHFRVQFQILPGNRHRGIRFNFKRRRIAMGTNDLEPFFSDLPATNLESKKRRMIFRHEILTSSFYLPCLSREKLFITIT